MTTHGCSLCCTGFESFSSFLQSVITFLTGSVKILHYLFDPANSAECLYLLMKFPLICQRFGVPEKSVWPTTCIKFLGVIIDTDRMELPQTKLDCLRFLL